MRGGTGVARQHRAAGYPEIELNAVIAADRTFLSCEGSGDTMRSCVDAVIAGPRSFAASLILVVLPALGLAQGAPRTPRADSLREAVRLDVDGSTARAREILSSLVASAPDARARADAQRATAMSYAFDGDCANATKQEDLVIAYWATREAAEPQNAFYQEGEMANEAARVCIDAGALDIAERYYRLGTELGIKEPDPRTHPASLWQYRLQHALGRLAARRGDAAEAQRHVAEARRILDADSAMAAAQERFFPYLVGYVALYTNDLPTAESSFTTMLSLPQNRNDPFMHGLLAMTWEKMGQGGRASEEYRKAYDLATAHNPPSAFARPFVRRKLASP